MNMVLSQSAYPGFNAAIREAKTKVDEKKERAQITISMAIVLISAVAHSINRSGMMMAMSIACAIAIVALDDKTLAYYIGIGVAPLGVVQKIVFVLGRLVDEFIVSNIKMSDRTFVVIKGVQYVILASTIASI